MREEGRLVAVNPGPPPTEPTTGVDMHFSVHPGLLMNTNSQLGADEEHTDSHRHTHTYTPKHTHTHTDQGAAGEVKMHSLWKRNKR